jgi:hypothetical protein
MAIVTTITKIRAPAERVFDLSRSVDLHVRSAGSTGETAITGVTSGLLELRQEVTWRGKHFGVWQNLTSKITRCSRPDTSATQWFGVRSGDSTMIIILRCTAIWPS